MARVNDAFKKEVKMFDRQDILFFKNFCQKIIEAPRPLPGQPLYAIKDGFLWCEDWKIIEILKYCFNGREGYYGDPPPNRLKRNPFFSKDAIAAEAEALIAEFKTAEKIVEHLREVRNG